MKKNKLNRFYIYVVFPSILTIGLFIISIFTFILPSFEKNIMNGKKEIISELTNTVCSLIDEYYNEIDNETFPENTAKEMAIERIRKIRYGDDLKDYFWIIDEKPIMIMHPYRTELVGKDMNTYSDPDGKLLFVEAVKKVDEENAGYIDYMWQWKDDSTRIVPKLSYVKAYEPWGWVIGTGIYLEDVRIEIKSMKSRLLNISLLITLLISILLAFVIRQSLNIEKRRLLAENRLRLSREKYKSLVEASTEGTLMFMNDQIIFSNLKFSQLSGYDPQEVSQLSFDDLFKINWIEVKALFSDPKKSVIKESILVCKDKILKDVLIATSVVSYSNSEGYIVVVKELSGQQEMLRAYDQLSDELQTSLIFMSQPVKPFIKEIIKCPSDTEIRKAAELMVKKQTNALLVEHDNRIIGIINNNDFKERVVAKSVGGDQPVIEIMTSPVASIPDNTLLYEVLLRLKSGRLSNLAVTDDKSRIYGLIGLEDMTRVQSNTISMLIHEIENSNDTHSIATVYQKLPVLIRILTENHDRARSITRIITDIGDAITKRVIELAIESLGEPPCKFAFIAFGSEGRGEQTLATDQDNAIIYEELIEEVELQYREYFLALGEKINRDLDYIGYKFCPGGIMAKNPGWNQSLDEWKNIFSKWIINGNPQDILEAAIFFDFRYIAGEKTLVDELRDHVTGVSKNKSVFFYHLAQGIIKYKTPVSHFSNIVSQTQSDEKQNLDLKKVIFPLTSFIRLYSVVEGFAKTNSFDRLDKLREKTVLDKETIDEIYQALSFLTVIRLRSQIESMATRKHPDNNLNINILNRIEISLFKKYLGLINDIQSKTGFDFLSAS